ncbi:MAG: DUF1287 domain-containing protein [Spirochaetales bacterium]|nr:DUF1287 domain-containing protein [Spirochaetales bacterium]
MYEEHNFVTYVKQQTTRKRKSEKPRFIPFIGLGVCCVLGIILSLAIIRLFLKYGPDMRLQFPLRAADYAYYKTHKTFGDKLAKAAESLTKTKVRYDSSYFAIDYPGGDVPPNKGVCSDVVVRAYRKLGIDLQVEVHEDIKKAWSSYPHKWGMTKPDPNIDHRRVFNLMTFFKRKGGELPVTRNALDYKPGDIVVWGISRGRAHIGVVSTRVNINRNRYLIVHNMGSGQIFEDILFDWPIIGHYRYLQ